MCLQRLSFSTLPTFEWTFARIKNVLKKVYRITSTSGIIKKGDFEVYYCRELQLKETFQMLSVPSQN